MRDLSKVLKNREINDASITNLYKAKILDDQFEVIIDIKNKTSKIIDLSSNEEYVLVDVENAVGEFVGCVCEAYENVINNVINRCTYAKVFKNLVKILPKSLQNSIFLCNFVVDFEKILCKSTKHMSYSPPTAHGLK